MGKDNFQNDVKSLIFNILLNNTDVIDIIKEKLKTTNDLLDLAMILLALDISDLQTGTLKLTSNQFKNLLLESYLNINDTNNNINKNNIGNTNNNINNTACDVEEMLDDDDNYNTPGAPIEVYGQESADGFIYIDNRQAMPYEPLTEEVALKYVFLEKRLLPPPGSKTHIDQRFQYVTDDGEIRMCVRRFVIDDKGHVVRFLGESTKAVNFSNDLITDDFGFQNGTLSDLLNIQDDTE